MNNRPHDEQIIVIFTAGWRFLAALSVMAFLTQFLLYISGFSGEYPMAAGILFFLCAMYFIFRLWLDHHLFRRLAQSSDTDIFDESLTTLFPGRAQHPPLLTALARHKTAVSAGRSLHGAPVGSDGDCPA